MAVRKRGGVSAVHIRTICAVQCTTGPVCCLPPGRRVAVAAAPPAERAWRGRERQRRATPPGDARWLWCTRVPGEWGVLPAVRARRQTCARRGQADVSVSPPPPPCPPPCHTPCCTLVNFYWCRRRLRPFCPPLGPGRRSGACCWRWLLSPLPVQPPQESSLCGFTHVAFSYCMLALAALALAILLNSALCRGFTFTITQQMY